MTRDVLIRLSGLQAMEGDEGTVEVITSGDYFWKNNKHYLIYDEVMEGMDGAIRNTMKLTPDKLEIRKSGPISASMVFEVDKKTQTHYATPMGEMLVEIGFDLKKRSPFAKNFIVELANGCNGYIGTKKSFSEGGYEVTLSSYVNLCEDAAETINSTLVELLQKMR